jgi:hypothetical protein
VNYNTVSGRVSIGVFGRKQLQRRFAFGKSSAKAWETAASMRRGTVSLLTVFERGNTGLTLNTYEIRVVAIIVKFGD